MNKQEKTDAINRMLTRMQSDRSAPERQLEEAICDYMANNCGSEVWESALEQLPDDRSSAVALLRLIQSFDLFELYEAMFDRFADYLDADESAWVTERAKETFESELLRRRWPDKWKS